MAALRDRPGRDRGTSRARCAPRCPWIHAGGRAAAVAVPASAITMAHAPSEVGHDSSRSGPGPTPSASPAPTRGRCRRAVQVGVGVLQRVVAILDRHHPADVLRRPRALDVGPHVRREVATRADATAAADRTRAPRWCRPRDCFSKATVSTRSSTPLSTRWVATTAVEPPTLPAVCTRIIGLPRRRARRRSTARASSRPRRSRAPCR